MNKRQKFINKKRKLNLEKDNRIEDKIIRSLEKKLKIKKRTNKNIPKSFNADGLDYLLDVCDGESRNIITESEKQLLQLNESDNSDYICNIDNKFKSKVKQKVDVYKKKIYEAQNSLQSLVESASIDEIIENGKKKFRSNISVSSKSDSEIKDNIGNFTNNITIKKTRKCNTIKNLNNIRNKSIKNNKISTNDLFKCKKIENGIKDTLNSESKNLKSLNLKNAIDFDNNEGIWEDIYGRKRSKDGFIISEIKEKYIMPALRIKFLSDSTEKSEQLLILRRQIKGLLNRLAESNMHVIISQLDELYMVNSRNDMNEMLSNIMLESIVAPILTSERLIIEHMICIAILHANIGTEVGAHFIMTFVKKYNEMIKKQQEVQNKEIDNVFGSQLIYQILENLVNNFTEKEIELILLFLKTAGFKLRKDDPLALKELILNIQEKVVMVTSSNSRVQFMLNILIAIKNNNMNKISQYDQSHIQHLKKIMKTLIRKGNSISQLNISLEDLLNADEKGKWWIIGSAWSGKLMSNDKSHKPSENKPVYSKKILSLAHAQRMNTDIRKNIFCILMTAEDYLDAFEKLHHLGLKDRQEKEIIYVILNCLLQERNFNPYYAVLIQKFCEYNRKYQIIMQYTLWDKLKLLSNYNNRELINIARLMSYLFIHKALPLSILKVIEFGELDKSTMNLMKKIMLDILLYENTEICLNIFRRIAFTTNLNQFRDGLRLFINYFLLKNVKKETLLEKEFELLEKRIEMVDELLINSASTLSF